MSSLISPSPARGSRLSTFRPDIEGLRGIAILIVVAFHTGIPGFSGGFVGVDVFFVLSGYLITGLLVTEIQKSSRLNLLNFYARRVRRLLPASALTLVFTLLVGIAILAPNELLLAGRAARATAVYMSNIFFAKNAEDYFAPKVESNPMLHTWSLAVEEQFYLFWPLLIMLGLQWLRSTKALLMMLFGLTAVSLGACVWFTAKGGTFAFYQLPARAWEFGVGGLAVLPSRPTLKMPFGKMRSGAWAGLGWVGLLLVLGSGSFIQGGVRFPGWIAVIPVLGTIAALVSGAALPGRGVGVVLNSAPLQSLGSLSYSWYLWHWPFLVFAGALFPNISMVGRIAVSAASLGLAAVTHHLVENPIRFHPYLIERPARSIYLALIITVCSVGAGTIAMRFAGQMANAPGMRRITAAIEDIARIPRQQCVSLEEATDVKTCMFGDNSSTTNIVLFGDSHAIQWFNPLQRMAESHGWKLTTVLKSGCPATDIKIPGSSGTSTSCENWRAEAIRRIGSLRPALVLLGNATVYLDRIDRPTGTTGVSLADWRNGTKRTLQALTALDLRVAVMRDNPLPAVDIPTCLARSLRHSWYPGGSCEMAKSTALNPAIFEAEQAGARNIPNVHFIDLTGQFCQKEVCWAVQNGEIMYRDDNHITGGFADRLRPVLEAQLLPILLAQ